MRNTGSTKLNMIIELYDDEDLVDATTALDASHDETSWIHDVEEALDTGATKGIDFPFDTRGATDHVIHDMQSLEFQPTYGMGGGRLTYFLVEHRVAIPWHAGEEACGNAPMDKEEIH